MNPRERATLALEGKQADIVPHFELEMQLTEEYFGRPWPPSLWPVAQGERREFCEQMAATCMKIADHFDYCAILTPWMLEASLEDDCEAVRALREADGGQRLLLSHCDSTLAIPTGSDMVELSVSLVEKPDEVKDGQERGVDWALERGRRLLEAGADGFFMGNDYCFNDNPFLSPQMFAEFVTPYLSRLVKGFREMGAYAIKHTDGNIMPILDQLAAARPHALHSLDPQGGVDIAEVKKRVGDKLCLIGNVNCGLMQTGTEQEILESCRYAMENGKPGGGYIFSTSNVIFKGMPKRSYDLMLDYYRQNNSYSG